MKLLVPTRGRPARAETMAVSAVANASDPIEVFLIVDADDMELERYRRLLSYDRIRLIELPERVGYTASLNRVARNMWNEEDEILGAFGDDVIFRTPGWDRMVAETLDTPGIAYGDDLIHGKNHPSAVWMNTLIPRTLGWMALPATSHQWADDAWKRLGQEINRLRFIDGLIVEHMHPGVAKAEWDDTYRSVFEEERAKADYDGFTAWAEGGGLADDAARVRMACYFWERDRDRIE